MQISMQEMMMGEQYWGLPDVLEKPTVLPTWSQRVVLSRTVEEFKYNLIIIDHNVSVQNLDHTHEIIFLKDGYGIFCDKNSSVKFNDVYDKKDNDNNENNRKYSEDDFILT